MRRTGSRLMLCASVPESFFTQPCTSATYFFFTSRAANCALSLRCAASFLATRIRPLGNSLERRPLRLTQHADALPAAQLQRSLCWSGVYQHLAFGDHLLHPRPAHGFKASGEELI